MGRGIGEYNVWLLFEHILCLQVGRDILKSMILGRILLESILFDSRLDTMFKHAVPAGLKHNLGKADQL